MEQKSITKQEEHRLNTERFKKTPQEKEQCKAAKSEWKRTNPKKK